MTTESGAASSNAEPLSKTLLDPISTYDLLMSYDVPVIDQQAVDSLDPADVAEAAESFGYPLVLKAISPLLVHKSDVGGVRMNLFDEAQVERAADQMLERIPDITGFLLQSQAPAGHELIIGALQDETFGPVVMFGLGGVWTELLGDVSIRLAPVDHPTALQMIHELRGSPLLLGYRGARPVELDAVAGLIVNVSRLIAEHPNVAELDLNPVIAGLDELVAVDARIIRDDRELTRFRPFGSRDERLTAIRKILAPESIAVVGASSDARKPGGRLFSYLIKHGFTGSLYAVNPGTTEIMGKPSVARVEELPESVDLACIMLPSDAVSDVVERCGKTGIESAIVYTSGFAETGEAGRRLQQELLISARTSGVRLCGPNTAGVVNANRSICSAFGMAFEIEAMPGGDIAFITQSGALGSSLLSRTWEQGIGFSHWVCSGNEADLTLSDYLDYLVDDPDARVIAIFMESLRDPDTFMRAAGRARSAGKPIVVNKTGSSDVGQRAVQSHTGSLAGDDRVYGAAFHQAGVARVGDLQALIDASVALAWQPLPGGRRVGVISASGGACSVIADEAQRHGLELPMLEDATLERIRHVIPPFGAPQNPVDVTVEVTRNPEMVGRVTEILLAEDSVDAVVVLMTTNADPPALDVARGVVRASESSDKPVLVTRVGADFLAPDSVAHYRESKLPLYPMPDRAVKALRAMVEISESRVAFLLPD